MKKIIVLITLLSMTSLCFGQRYLNSLDQGEKAAFHDTKYSLSGGGFQLLTLTWLDRNEKGQIISEKGLHALMGYTQKNYFRPVQVEIFNYYWHWGTWFMAVPYVGIGVDYAWSNNWFVGIETTYIFPMIRVGKRF